MLKVVANISQGVMLRRSILGRARVLPLLDGGLELGMLIVLASSDFRKIVPVKRPPSLDLPYPLMSVIIYLYLALTKAKKTTQNVFFS